MSGSTQVQYRGDTTAIMATVVPAFKEIFIDTDKKAIGVGDGIKLGGFMMAREDSVNQLKDSKNRVFNGRFDDWARGTIQTTSGYGSAGAWNFDHNGSSKQVVRGQMPVNTVPGDPKYYCESTWTSVAGVGNFVRKTFRIADVRTFQGQQATLAFYAWADAARNIAVELVQNFGTGGSPSGSVTGIGAQLVPVSTAVGRKNALFNIPSIAGKTIGTNEDSYLEIVIWCEAGSNFNARTANLGQQSGRLDLAKVCLVPGDATGLVDPFPAIDEDLVTLKCRARFQRLQGLLFCGTRAVDGGAVYASYTLPVKMRAVPVGVATKGSGGANSGALTVGATTDSTFWVQLIVTSGSSQGGFGSAIFDIDLSADL